MSLNKFVYLDKNTIELCFKELGRLLKKQNKGTVCELIVVGGASILLNYGFRMNTLDVDCLDEHDILMNDLIGKVAEKYDLPSNWINTDFVHTKSYSPRLIRFSEHYKTYGNGTLEIRTIKDKYLLAMKLVSGRKYKNDFSDILGIIKCMISNEKIISLEELDNSIIDLYSSFENVNKEAYEFAKQIIQNPNKFEYEEIKEKETTNSKVVRAKIKQNKNQKEIEYILNQIDILDK